MATFTGSVRLPDGQVIPATGTATVRPRMLVGIDCQGATSTLADIDAHIGPGGLFPAGRGPSKLFWSTGAGLPTWTGKTAHIPAAMIPHLCFIDWPTQAAWTAWLDSVPATWREVRVTWLQEGDRGKGFTATAFRAKYRLLLDWSAGHPHRSRLRIMPNLTEYYERTKNGNDYGAWIEPGVDGLCVDVYPGTQTGYLSPAQCLAGPVAAAAAAGLPLYLPECGVVVPANPTLGQRQARADWYAGLFAAAGDAGVRDLAVWCTDGDQSVGTAGFHLIPGDPAYTVVRAATEA